MRHRRLARRPLRFLIFPEAIMSIATCRGLQQGTSHVAEILVIVQSNNHFQYAAGIVLQRCLALATASVVDKVATGMANEWQPSNHFCSPLFLPHGSVQDADAWRTKQQEYIQHKRSNATGRHQTCWTAGHPRDKARWYDAWWCGGHSQRREATATKMGRLASSFPAAASVAATPYERSYRTQAQATPVSLYHRHEACDIPRR